MGTTTTATGTPSLKPLAILISAKTISLIDVLPFIKYAHDISIHRNFFSLNQLTELPDFELHVGDEFIQYEQSPITSAWRQLRLVIRSDLIPSKVPGGCGTYTNVESGACRPADNRGKIMCLKALQVRCNSTPWYSTGSLTSWKFPRQEG